MAESVTCSVCGTTVEGEQPLTWSTSAGPCGVSLVCDRCTRDNVRAIEAKLEEEYW